MSEFKQEKDQNPGFGANLQFLRQQKNMSQEALAEQLGVTRQSVSKWESGASYPEMGTLVALCDLFHIDLDSLLRGSARRAMASDSSGYEKMMNTFGTAISAGVALILFGAGLLVGWSYFTEQHGLGEFYELLGVVALLLCILAAVVLFIVMGIRKDQFVRKNPVVEPFYTEKQLEQFSQRYVWLIAVPVGAILADVIVLILFSDWSEQAGLEGYLVMLFLWVIGGAASALTWTGIQESKYDVESYNRHNTPEYRRIDDLVGSCCGCIMLAATAYYVYRGLVHMAWHTDYWVFAVGGICCGIVSVVIGTIQDRKLKAQEQANRE